MSALLLFPVFLSFFVGTLEAAKSSSGDTKVYGVNLGSWLVLEPWMLPQEWLDMGGEQCADCSTCVASEFAFAQRYPDKVDREFDKHWTTWFSQKDVDQLVDAGINTVRIPLGYWIVEPLVDRRKEFYPRGGLRHLIRGLKQLKDAGIAVILDHHALPGVQSPQQMFAGRCTRDVQFYTDYNYHRALVWTAVMTAFSHLDPSFGSVISIQAVNEPIMDANLTPGYGDFQKHFVQTVRAVEFALGIPYNDVTADRLGLDVGNLTSSLLGTTSSSLFDGKVNSALADALPILREIGHELNVDGIFHSIPSVYQRHPLITSFMDINWQHNNPSNPADAKKGPQAYDNHLYYVFGGVADPNEEAYMKHICTLDRVERDEALGNSPLVFGEWALPTQFPATDAFLRKWADAQKLAYTKGAGWIFWNFKIEISPRAGDTARVWSYFEGLRRGYFTKDPSQLHDPNVCNPYIN